MWLAFKDVTCQYRRGAVALHDISFRVSAGLWTVTGPNSSGKTTLLRCAAGILPPVSGQLLWNGQDAYRLGGRFRGELGFAPQGLSGRSGLTVGSYLIYMAALKGLRRSAHQARVAHMLALCSLTAYAEQPVTTLSGGLRSRLALAQALLNDPELLILDEPLRGLDPAERVRFRQLLVTLSRERVVLATSHIASDFEGVEDGAIQLRDGCLESFA